MIKPCAKITLDIQQPSTATFVALKKRDIGRKIIISLSDGGFPYEIADDCYAVLTAKKPDNKTLYNHCEIDGNTIVYEITEQTTAAAGRMKAEVKLYGADDTLITSATFRIIVDGTVYDEGEVESTSEFSALTDLIVKVTELLNSGDLIGEDGYSIFLTSYELPFVADGGGGSIALNTSSISLTEIQTQGKTVKAGDLVISENGVVGSVTAVSAGKASVKSVVNIVSPHVGDNGNWYVGTIDTGVPAKGEDGISTSLTVKYGVSDSSTESPGDWVEAFPILTESYPYLWMQVTLTTSSGTATSDCGVIGVYGSAKQQGFDVPATKNLNMGGKAINGINYASFNDAGGDPDGGTYMVSEDVIYDEEGHVAGQVFGFYGSCGDEPVVLRNIHTPLKDGDAANKEYVDQAVANSGGNVDLGVTGATVGQTAKISAVNENGVPTAWEPVNFPSGSSGGSGGGTKWETLVNEVWQRNRELKFTEYDADTLTYTFPDGTFTDDEIGTEILTVICLDVNSIPDSWLGVFPSVLTPISTNQATIKAAQNSLLDGKNYWFEVPTLLHVKGINSKKIRVRWDGKVARSFESAYSKYFAYGMPDSQVASQIGYYQTKVARSIADIELELIAPYIVSGNLNAYIFAASDSPDYHKKWFSSYSPVLQDMSSVNSRQYAYSEDGLTFSGLCWSITPWNANTGTVAFIGNGTRIYVAREVDA